jgi:hypothetical protein
LLSARSAPEEFGAEGAVAEESAEVGQVSGIRCRVSVS